MAYITLDKTWNIVSCVADPGIYVVVADQNKRALYLLKEAFVTAGWIVTQSSDSINVGSGSNLPADRWIDYSKLIWAVNPTAHSWVVLKNTAIGTNFSICIDCCFSSATTSSISVTATYGGYQAGTIQNRPIANINCIEHVFSTIVHNSSTANNNHGYGVLYSSDGECIRVFASYDGTGVNYTANAGFIMLFEKLKNPVSWLDYNYVAIVASAASGVGAYGFSYLNLCASTSISARTERGNVVLYVGVATLGLGTDGAFGNSASGKYFPDYNGNYMLTECYAVSNSTTNPGLLGQFYDMYFAPANIPEGIFFPTTTHALGLVKIGQGVFGCSGNTISIP
jgi:hypothetical protein